MIAKERLFESRGSLASALATDVANALSHQVMTWNKACLAVSGGTTPKLFFETLSRIDIPWRKIVVTLVDERQVPETSPRSNARLVRENLIQNRAAGAEFVPLFENPEAENIPAIDVAVLGMGSVSPPGKNDAVWPSLPMPRTATSIAGMFSASGFSNRGTNSAPAARF